MIDIDITLVYQIIGFIVLLFFISRFMVKPVVRVLEERDKRIAGARDEAAKIEENIDSGKRDYDEKLKASTLGAMEERTKLRAETQAEEQKILDEARGEANGYLEDMRTRLVEGKDTALATLKGEAASLSRNIADKVLDKKVLSILLPLILTLLPAIAFGSTEGGDEHGGAGMGWKIFNFILLVVGIYIVWKKMIKGMLEQRGVDIKTALEEAKKCKDAADEKEREYTAKLATLDEKVAHIKNEFCLEGKAEKERLLKEAAEASRNIKEQAKLIVEQETIKAKLEIREEVATLAVKMAEDILQKELSDDDQKRLVKNYLEELRLN